MTGWPFAALRRWAFPLFAAAMLISAALPAEAGSFRLEPGAATRIDTGERQQYTTITIVNPGAAPSRLILDAPVNREVEIPAGETVELYGLYNRSSVAVRNSGQSRLEIVTRYMETWRLP